MRYLTLILAASLLAAACADGAATTSSVSPDTTLEPAATDQPTQESTAPTVVDLPGATATVTGTASGNRVHQGSADLTDAAFTDIPLNGVPVWVVGVETRDGPMWVVALEDGTVEAWAIVGGKPERRSPGVGSLPPGTPPLVSIDDGKVEVVAPPADASPLTHPVIVDGTLVYVTTDGRLVVAGDGTATTLSIDALLDSRLSVSQNGLVSVLAGPTDRYPHAVLGDNLEAARIVVVDVASASVVGEATISEPSVIEGIAAPWVDADGDGSEELLVTVSNGEVGARLALYAPDGQLVAEGPPIGQGNRWRNQLGAGPVGPDGEIGVIDVRVPHIGGVVEYFRLQGDELVRAAERSGFTSHGIGSRNLDWALAADLTGDGRLDVVAPTQDRAALGILSRTLDGVEVVTELDLPGRLTSNLSFVGSPDGSLAAGTTDGILRVWG